MLNNLLARVFSADERFIMHRYYSTRWALVVSAIFMGAWVLYDYFLKDTVRSDFILILAIMAVTKIGFLLYYRLTH